VTKTIFDMTHEFNMKLSIKVDLYSLIHMFRNDLNFIGDLIVYPPIVVGVAYTKGINLDNILCFLVIL
jgi:hypothetical protein